MLCSECCLYKRRKIEMRQLSACVDTHGTNLLKCFLIINFAAAI